MTTLNAVVVMQEENWQDDGGDHDPILVALTQEQFDDLSRASKQTIDFNEYERLLSFLLTAPRVKAPCTVHGVFNIWFSYSS